MLDPQTAPDAVYSPCPACRGDCTQDGGACTRCDGTGEIEIMMPDEPTHDAFGRRFRWNEED
jgi:hypothetical protein